MEPVVLSSGIGDNRATATLYYGQDVRETLRLLPEASVHTVCTSPPYFNLRDYGKDGQIGLEATPEGFVAALVEVFREVRRVLRDDGTVWLNLGDSYVGGHTQEQTEVDIRTAGVGNAQKLVQRRVGTLSGFKSKDLLGIPWRVAFALQADGWYLRQDIVWAKPNPMPESVTDRCTKAHEYVFLLAHPDSGGRYYYDADAVKERAVTPADNRGSTEERKLKGHPTRYGYANRAADKSWSMPSLAPSSNGRNRRSVWNVNVAPYTGSHFAVWPPELVRPMVLAGCPVGGTVLDLFSGSGTTGMVALQEGRHYIGIDLNEDYLSLAMNRVQELPAPGATSVEDDAEEEGGDAFDLFSGG